MRNPLGPLVRFALYILAAIVGIAGVYWTTRDVGATLIATQSALLSLAAGKVFLAPESTGVEP